MRPPAVSILFFAAVPAMLAAGVFSARAPAPPASAARETPAHGAGAQTLAPPEIDFYPAYLALDPAAPMNEAGANAVFNPADPYGGLPQTEGYDLVAAYCSACHSLRVVMQQRPTPRRWDELLDWMVEKQGMAEPDPETRAAIRAYLVRHFSTQSE